MALETAPAIADAGQAAGGPATTQQDTSSTAPGTATAGQATEQPTGQAVPETPAAPAEQTFFDPAELPPELMPAYKSMQSAWTKKMQAIAAEKKKVQAYDAFAADPVGQMQRMAMQYGYQLTRAQAAAQLAGAQGSGQATQPQAGWEPQSWDEVISRTKEETTRDVLAKLAPHLQQIQQVRAQTIESQLNELDPAWREYEDHMRDNLQKHPTLVDDPATLYRLSVPEEVITNRAYHKALRKLEDKAQGAAVAGKSSTSAPTVPQHKPPASFAEAVIQAKEEMARKGRI